MINRKVHNDIILSVLQTYLEKNPTMRFSQALCNLDLVKMIEVNQNYYWKDEYYLEPSALVERLPEEK